jgi:hypothetical protein
MANRNGNLPIWMQTNAWREIFARIFEDIKTEINVSPAWLINPATKRRLKLDLLYPDLGVAVRFEGLQGKQRRQRPSLEEEIQQRTRDDARLELCRARGIELIAFNVAADAPKTVFRMVDEALSRAGRRAKDPEQREKIKQVRTAASTLAYRLKQSVSNLKLYAELWQDRQFNQIPEPAQSTASAANPIDFRPGMEVEHTTFGPGVIIDIKPSGNDQLLTVDFVTAGQKTLVASLVTDKLRLR